jgi:outer membrane scaffolding protein for murein synthesis (MipA/OmpV family)
MTIRACFGIACLTLAATAQSQETASAPDLPLWEAGVFGGAATTPAYPGAEDRSTRALLLPMLIYRGKILRADRSGIGARLINTERVELDIGFALSLPARSKDTGARASMPDLNSLLEFGPRLKVQLADRTRLELPLRVPVELRNGFERQGLVFEPRLVFETAADDGKWTADANIGTVYGNTKLNQYFYEVTPQYVTATRPQYQASGGLMMTRLGVSLSRRVSPDWRIFGFARYDNLSHAANRESPLFRKNSGLSAGIGFTWTAHRSTARAWD